MNAPILQTENISRSFGGLQAVKDVSIRVEPGEVYAIIGPNGAGKTTFFNIVSGTLRPDHGKIFFHGRNITDLPLHKMAHIGIGRAFQITSLFPNLSVLENARLAAQACGKHNRRFWKHSDSLPRYIDTALQVLEQVGLADRIMVPASALSHGEKRKLELALILASEPELLLLDEPTAGMASNQVPELLEIIKNLRQRGNHTIMLVEHRMDVVMQVSDRIMVMHSGAMLAEGTPHAIANNADVQQAYLGGLYEDVLHEHLA